jgi:hypothetical protein
MTHPEDAMTRERALLVLDGFDAVYGIACVIHGGANGADYIAGRWAQDTGGIPVEEFPADWNRHGNSAGPIRNQEMLDKGKPDLVVAFPGGRGTADIGPTRSQGRHRSSGDHPLSRRPARFTEAEVDRG